MRAPLPARPPLPATCLLMMLTACGGEAAVAPAPPAASPASEPEAPAAGSPGGATAPGLEAPTAAEVVGRDEPTLPAPPPPSSADAATIGAATQGFGAALFRALGRPAAESFAVAPVSVAAALGMTAAGARGTTRDEMLATLGLTSLGEGAPAALGGVLGALESDELVVANRLYARDGLEIEAAFVAQTRDLFRAPVERVVFGEPARALINGWVDARTAHRIPEILPPGSVDSGTELVLVNAMYFLATWHEAFDERATRDDYFAAPSGRVTCRMMRRERATAMLGTAEGVSVLSLPYAGDRFVGTFVLPDAGSTLEAVEAAMDGARVAAWLTAPQRRTNVTIEIPRFRVEASAPVSLGAPLRSLGMVQAFDGGAADFSGIAPPDPRRLFVTDVFHRVFVETTERGTEAAAATAVVMARGAAAPEETLSFRADRPFLFLVTERATGTLLFLARVATPGSPG